MKIKLGIIFGGQNIKQDKSIDKVINLVEYIDKNKYEIIPIYISENKIWYMGKMLLEKDIYNYFDDLKKYAKKICITKHKEHFILQTTGKRKRNINYLDLVIPMIDDDNIFGYLETLGIPYVGTKTVDGFLLKDVLKANNIKTVKYGSAVEDNFPLLLKTKTTKIKINSKKELENKIKIYKNALKEEYIAGDVVDCILLDNEPNQIIGISNEDDLESDIQDKIKKITKNLYNIFSIKEFLKVRFIVDFKNKQVYVDSLSTIMDIDALYILDKRHKNYTYLIDDIISITIEHYKKLEENQNS